LIRVVNHDPNTPNYRYAFTSRWLPAHGFWFSTCTESVWSCAIRCKEWARLRKDPPTKLHLPYRLLSK
jgi:hypothetical protein